MFACNFCKGKFTNREDGSLVYRQPHPRELDLFDGVRANGINTSIGIGDEQPPELACLTVYDHLAQSVLKMADATFAAYSGPGYTHISGGGLLAPSDYHGLATLLIERRPISNGSRPGLPPGANAQRVVAALQLLRCRG